MLEPLIRAYDKEFSQVNARGAQSSVSMPASYVEVQSPLLALQAAQQGQQEAQPSPLLPKDPEMQTTLLEGLINR